SVIDLQFEVLTTYLNDGNRAPERCGFRNAHAYLSAPYGIYQTAHSYLAVAMNRGDRLRESGGSAELAAMKSPDDWFTRRDEIKRVLAQYLQTQPTSAWLDLFEPQGVWCSDVLTWDRLLGEEGFTRLNMIQRVVSPNGAAMETTRCPI